MIRDLSAADPALVALCGRAGSGKSEAADYLAAEYGFETVAFADGLKDMLCAHFADLGIDYAHLYEPALKGEPLESHLRLTPRSGEPITARRMLQSLGDWGRGLDTDYWIACLALRAGLHAGASPVHDRILITDVRYFNEAHWARLQGSVLIRLERDSAAPVREHSTEQEVDALQVDATVANHGPTLEGLRGALRAAMADLRLEPRPSHRER